jgi:S-DNA-T family DNA segregation ATPase FtsK/SpoIIIE
MPRLVSVSDVRRVLYSAAGGQGAAGAGDPSQALLGVMFHSTFAGLTGADERMNFVRPLERADRRIEAWTEELVAHAYPWHVAPALAEHAGLLQPRASEVLGYWSGVQALCRWLAEIVWEQVARGLTISEARRSVFFAHEQEASVELSDPGWSQPVLLHGRIDALLRQPATGVPCIVELKTGRGAPEADVSQAALYHLIQGGGGPSHVAVVTFAPEPREHLFEPERLKEALSSLRPLIGRLAGVVREAEDPKARPARANRAAGAAEAHRALGERLIRAFAEHGVGLRLDGEPLAGPAFVRYFVQPGRGVRLTAVQKLADTVWLRIGTTQPPQVSVQHGRLALDVEREDRQTVAWALLRAELSHTAQGSSRFPIGVAVDGSVRWADLARPENSHFLVAGTAGSGKSEWLRAAIASLLAMNTPDDLRLILVDPKRTAFVSFEGAPALWRPVVYPSDEDPGVVLQALIDEMERRYQKLAAARVQDLALLAEAGERIPRLVLVCDEFADLLMAGDRARRAAMETLFTRLAQKGRAAGVHLIMATQRPSRDVVKGTLDANLMARVALKVTKDLESRIIIGDGRAATLLGRGDLLFRDLGEPVRMQSPYVTEAELAGLLRG